MATEMKLKLLVDKKTNMVLFAEAGKDAVDFLFSLLSMPLGSIVKLLTQEKMVGCIGSLYKSMETLDETYVISDETRTSLLDPTPASPLKNTLFLTGPSSTGNKYYTCISSRYEGCKKNYTDVYAAICSSCRNQMTLELLYVSPTAAKTAVATGEEGIVRGVVTYTVMDDLTVTPMSTISGITLLNKFNFKDLSLLEERTVDLGIKEVGFIVILVSLIFNILIHYFPRSKQRSFYLKTGLGLCLELA